MGSRRAGPRSSRSQAIVAVIPDNQDRSLVYAERDADFWERFTLVRKDWAVACMDATHVMHPTQSELLLPFYRRSEFAGSIWRHRRKNCVPLGAVFWRRIEPRIWVAPAHCSTSRPAGAAPRDADPGDQRRIRWDAFIAPLPLIPQQLWNLRSAARIVDGMPAS